jgi:amino acid adenylation domain-containing protein
LPSPQQTHLPEGDAEIASPRTPIEEAIAAIWCEVLGDEQIGIHENFFDLGGHSLLAAQLMTRVQAVFQVEMPVRSLFEAPTIAGLAQRVEQQLQAKNLLERPPLLPVPRTQDIPLSFAQQRLWFLAQLEPESTVYLIPSIRWMHGKLNVAALERSLYALQLRHESLRTTFPVKDKQPIQLIQPMSYWQLPVIDLTGLAPHVREEQAHRLIGQEAHLPCDLVRGPLMRVRLLQLGVEEQILLLTMHHIISDGWSSEVLWRELITLYQAFVRGEMSPLPPLPIQYADFAVWQRQWLRGAVLEQHLAYWRAQLEGIPPLELPTDHLRPAIKTYRGAVQSLQLPISLQEELLVLSQREQVTLFMLLLAAFQVLLARYSGQQDIAVGTPIANRTERALEGLIGFFVNTLVMRIQLQDHLSFTHLLGQVREVALGAYTHQDVPFEYLVEMLHPERDLSRSPFFQIMFTLQQQAATSPQTSAAAHPQEERTRQQKLPIAHTTTKFDLTLNVMSSPQGLSCGVEYNTDLFEATTIQQMLAHWKVLLEGIAASPDAPLATLPLLSEEERQRLISDHADAPMPVTSCLHTLFERQVALTPDAVALVFEDEQLTYDQLNIRANQLAHQLRVMGVQSEELVGICLERSLWLPVAILGILKAGGAYVPLDPSYPPERLAFMLTDAGISKVVTVQKLAEGAPLKDERLVAICFDANASRLAEQAQANGAYPTAVDQLAYVIYTSGSTGIPKGVLVSHANVVRLFSQTQDSFQFQAEDVWTLFHSSAFDFSVWELWGALLYGGRLVIVPYWVSRSPTMFSHLLQQQRVTILNQTPSAFYQLLVPEVLPQSVGGSLRLVIFGGEALEAARLQPWIRLHGDQRPHLVNMYGITETTVHVTLHFVSQEEVETSRRSVIGEEIADLRLYVLDRHQLLVPIGVAGELYVGGMGVARGYLGRAELTSERFVPDPFSGQTGARLYRTGDRVRARSDGKLEYMGRVDQQVKIRGYRIELGEIEQVLREYAGVGECAVLVREKGESGPQLLGYVAPLEQEQELETGALRRYLQKRLPEYMVPGQIVLLERLPLSPNGKLDRRALPAPESQSSQASAVVAVARTPIEEALAEIWYEVLGNTQIGIHDNFFERGGHSLLAAQLVSRVQAVFQVELPIRSLFEAPTIAGLAQQVEQLLRGGQHLAKPPLLPVARTQDLPLSFAQQRLWLIDQLEPGNTAYLIVSTRKLHGFVNAGILERSFEELVQRHESLRTTFHMHEGQPVQRIHPAGVYCLPVVDLCGLAPEAARVETRRLIAQEARRSFDLSRDPSLRTLLVHAEPQEYMLLLTMHHINFDGWSSEVLFRELATLYKALEAGQPSPLRPLPIQYADYAVWQRQWLQGEVLESQLSYWMRQLSGMHPLILPTDRPRPPVQSHRGLLHTFVLPEDLSQALIALSRQEGTTLFMTLLAAFQILFYRYSGQQDIAIGADIAGRNQAETESLIGFFINLLVLRTDLAGTPSFREVLQRVREMVLQAYTYQETPFELIVEKLAPQHSINSMPLVQALFVMQSSSTVGDSTINAASKSLVDEVVATKFDMALFMGESAGQIHGGLNYSVDLFEASTIKNLLARFEVLLKSIVAQPGTLIDKLDFLSEDEQKKRAIEEKILRNELRMGKGERFDL